MIDWPIWFSDKVFEETSPMMKKALAVFALFLLSASTHATDFFYRLGFSWRPAIMLMDFDDPDTGSTEPNVLTSSNDEAVQPVSSTSEFQPANGVISYKIDDRNRALFNFGYYSFAVRGDSLSVFQDVEILQLGFSYQHRFSITDSFALWLGGGLMGMNSTFEERYVPNTARTYSTRLEDRETSEAGIRLEVETDSYRPFRYTGVSLFSAIDYSLGDDGLSLFSAGLSLKYGIF